jgi:phosphatidylglycerophosphate synthase
LGITLFRAYSLRRHGTFIPANRWGKVKMILQSTFGVVLIAYAYIWNGGFQFTLTVVAAPLLVILLISYYSAIIYIKSWRETMTNVAPRAGVDGAGELQERRRTGESNRMVAGG